MEPPSQLKVTAFGHCPAAIALSGFQIVGSQFIHQVVMAAQGGKFLVESDGDTGIMIDIIGFEKQQRDNLVNI